MDTYDFENKHLYRKRREIAIDRMISKPIKLRKVAYLDTKEALDTISYLRRGYTPENLYAINNNPAEVAHLTMTLKKNNLPQINTIGLDFEDALLRRVPTVDIIDFDGMGCLSNKLDNMLNRIVRTRPEAVYGITILCGRESRPSGIWGILIKNIPLHKITKTSFGTDINPNHFQRLWLLLNICLSGKTGGDIESKPICITHIKKIIWDVYMSISKQPMLWVICKIEKHKKINEREKIKMFVNTNKICCPVCMGKGY
jgi:hypothetical protein